MLARQIARKVRRTCNIPGKFRDHCIAKPAACNSPNSRADNALVHVRGAYGAFQLWALVPGHGGKIPRIIRGAAVEQARSRSRGTAQRILSAQTFSSIKHSSPSLISRPGSRPGIRVATPLVLVTRAIWTLPISRPSLATIMNALGQHSLVIANIQNHKIILRIHLHVLPFNPAQRDPEMSLFPMIVASSSFVSFRLFVQKGVLGDERVALRDVFFIRR